MSNTLTGIEDGRADAFRHAYWNALGTAEFGSNITQIFTDAHEADSKWSNFQSKIRDFVNNEQYPSIYNGSSIINTPVKYRPNWAKVKDVLKGTRPISDLGCN